jgi:hypothetical protein
MPLSTKLELALSVQSNGVCKHCGKSIAAGAMILGRGICYECLLAEAGKRRTEEHHVFGRPGPAVVIPGNFHQALNRQLEARRPVLKRKRDDPLVAAAQLFTIIAELAEVGADYATCLGLSEWVAQLAKIIADACRSMADRQLSIYAHVADQLGPDWHKKGALS